MEHDCPPSGAADATRLLDALGQAVVGTDLDGRVTYWNPAAELLLGWPAEEARGRPIVELAVPFFSDERGGEILAGLYAGQPWSGPFTAQRKDGVTFTAIVTGSPVLDDAGQVTGVVGVVTDLGQLLRPFLSQSQEAAVVTDALGKVHFASPAVSHVLHWPDEVLPGRSLFDLIHPDDRSLVEQYARVARSAAHSAGQPPEFRLATPLEEWTWVEAIIADLLEEPSVRGLVWTFRDISERRADLERMTDVALHDPLTGLPNRVLLTDRIAQAAARRSAHGAVLFIDLDDFKQVNDELGHAAGDTLLQTVAGRLSHAMRPEDSCGRWAGDEFIVITESLDSFEEAQALADRVQQVIAEPVEIAGRRLSTHASIGVALLAGSRDPDGILRQADEAMYRVKQEHRRRPLV